MPVAITSPESQLHLSVCFLSKLLKLLRIICDTLACTGFCGGLSYLNFQYSFKLLSRQSFLGQIGKYVSSEDSDEHFQPLYSYQLIAFCY